MRCEEVRPLLPALSNGELTEAGPAEAHLVSCPACSAEWQRYRALVTELGALREDLFEPPEPFLSRMLALVPSSRWRVVTRRMAGNRRVQVAAVSVGGVVVGAAALGMLRRRARRRPPVAV